MNPAVVAALLFALALPQEAPDSRARAAELVRKTAAAQVQDGKAPVISDFQAELEVSIYERDPKDPKVGSPQSATVIEYYRDRGPTERPLFRRELHDKFQGKETIQGYDGQSFWQKLGNAPGRDLRGRESKDERDRVVQEMQRTKDYLRFLFLSNLDGPDVTYRHAGPRKLKANDQDRDCEVVVREKPNEAPIELFLGEREVVVTDGDQRRKVKQPVLWGFSRKMESGKTELIAFSVHTVVQSGGVTALVPFIAEYREDGALTFVARVPSRVPPKFNAGIADALFAIPR